MPQSPRIERRQLIAGLAAAPWLGASAPFAGLYQGQAYLPAGQVLDLSPAGPIRQAGPLLVSVWLADPQRLDRRVLGDSAYGFEVSVRQDRQPAHVLKTLFQADLKLDARAGQRLSVGVRNLSLIELGLAFRIGRAPAPPTTRRG